MSKILFAFNERNYRECQNTFRGDNNQEYYLGDYSIEAGSVIDVRADKKAIGSCSIIHLISRSKMTFKRSWSHIREDGTDVAVLWFVRRGQMAISHQSGSSVARTGDFAITLSTSPFRVECLLDEKSEHEVLHVIVPTHVLRRYMPQEMMKAGLTLRAEGREFAIAERLFAEVFDDAVNVASNVEQVMFESALSILAESIRGREDCTTPRLSLTEQRLQEVMRYIDVHLSDTRLSVTMVAEGCGISPRYLSHLLQNNGTPFSELVWDKRLKIASRWLAASKPNEISISEIAYRVGFKSPAHFSRMFKKVYKKGPREYRATGLAELPGNHQEFYAGASGSLQ